MALARRFLNPNRSRKALKGTISKGAMINTALVGVGAVSDYKTARDNGAGKIESLAKAGTEFAMGEMLGWWYMPYQLAKGIPSAAVGLAEASGKMQRNMNKTTRNKPFQNATFNDYSQAMTMRQAGMQMAQNSRYNLQQTLLGNEAQYLR